MKWRGVELAELDEATIEEALDQALRILGELWTERQRRKRPPATEEGGEDGATE